MSVTEALQTRIKREIAELAGSISEMVVSFRQLQRPLTESREKVPQATSQLDKITEQTEAAANRMLDMIEHITQREDEVISGIREIQRKVLAGEVDSIGQTASGLVEKANRNLNDAFMIMESLQFQDITAQQMDHAAALLDDIESKLHDILKSLGSPGATSTEQEAVARPRKKRAYDPHADFVDRKTDQKGVDSLFAKKQE